MYTRRRFNVGVYTHGFLNSSFSGWPLTSFAYIRSYHNKKFHHHIEALYKALGRKTTIKDFEEEPINTCHDLLDKETIKCFFREFNNKGGIYKFTLKNKPNIFYIGSTNKLQRRFWQHTNLFLAANYNDNFHLFALNVGWDKFNFAVLEVCNDTKTLRERENYFLKKYLPLLNTRFDSHPKIYKKFNNKTIKVAKEFDNKETS